MANRTNSSEYFWSYEYYWDYIDPIPVDGSKLKVNKYSIVIAFWVGLAAFVTFLFLILLYMSRSGSTPMTLLMLLLKCLSTHSYSLFVISHLDGRTVNRKDRQSSLDCLVRWLTTCIYLRQLS
uniref:Melanocortin-2 receptor accessory protein n=1 Tax=Amazona collaria TaxID=241587 RepID=A0A8B9EUW3_9PSIT